MTTAIITMAGFGRRFLDAGYTVPKYRIVVHGRSLFAWSMSSLNAFVAAGARFVFVVRADDDAADFIAREAEAIGIAAFEIIEIDAQTDGQATTAMLAAPAIADKSQPAFVYNIDTFVHPDALPAEAVRGDGWIPCFPGKGDGWSFAAADAEGRVTDIREKIRISDHATLGLYWFSSFALYEEAYDRYYSDPAHIERGERYIAPLYNDLLSHDRPVYIQDVPASAVIPLGVPAEVHAFEAAPIAFPDIER